MNFERSTVLFFCVIATLFLIGFTAHCISQNVDRSDVTFKQLVNTTYEMGWADETMIRNQELYANNTALEKKDGYNAMQALTTMIKTFSNAGQLISQPLFCKILKFDMQNDAILNADGTINTNKLMTSDEYWATKRDLIDSLGKEQANAHGFFYGIGTLLGDNSANKYQRGSCK
jgi:hypothetical protein